MSAIALTTIKTALAKWVAAGSGLGDTKVAWGAQGPNRPTAPFIELTMPSLFQPSHDWLRRAKNPLLGQGPSSSTPISSIVGSIFHATDHKFVTGDGPVGIGSDGMVPTPLDDDTDYWVIVVDANSLMLADSYEHTGGADPYGQPTSNPITHIVLDDAGSGSISITLGDNAVRAGKETKQTATGIREITMRVTCFGAENTATDALSLVADVLASAPLHVYELDIAGCGISTLGIADIESGIKTLPGKVGSVFEPRAFADISIYVGSEVVGTIGRIDKASITPIAKMVDGTLVDLPAIEINVTP